MSRPRLLSLSLTEKYEMYEQAVQGPDFDLDFIEAEYRRIKKHKPHRLREDFCGTGLLSNSWVKRSPKNEALGLDLSPEPIEYGLNVHYKSLKANQQARMKYLEMDVLKASRLKWKPDVVLAFNFSYFIFKTRPELLAYFKSVKKGLDPEAIFVLDIFGGLEAERPNVTKKDKGKFYYFWECVDYDLFSNQCTYQISFQKKSDKKKHEAVFTYDWRMWTPVEIKELLKEAGFENIVTYWEGEEEDGSGDGVFLPSVVAPNCESWVSYFIAY